jgi:hypothetical protein
MAVYYSEANGKLALQIAMRNKLNKKAIELHCELAKILSIWVGKKVVKVTPCDSWVSALGKRISQMAEQFLYDENCMYRLSFEFASCHIWTSLEIVFNDCYHTHYKKATSQLCSLEDSWKIAEISPTPKFKIDYDFQDVSLKIRELSDLQDRARNLEGELRYFAIH